MSITVAVLKAITAASKTKLPIKDIYSVGSVIGGQKLRNLYLAFTNTHFLLFDEKFVELETYSPVCYKDIDLIALSDADSHQMFIQVTDFRKNYPFWSSNRSQLEARIKILWITYQMVTTGNYVACPIGHTQSSYEVLQCPIPYMAPEYTDPSGRRIEYKGYTFWIPNDLKGEPFSEYCFKKIVTDNERQNKYELDNTVILEVSEELPINALPQGHIADNIKYLAEAYGVKLLRDYGCQQTAIFDYSKTFEKEKKKEYKEEKKEEKKGGDNKEEIREGKGDLAIWRGHKVLIHVDYMNLSIIVLRRDYIPPLLEAYQYIIVASFVKVRFTGDQEVKKNVEDKQEEEKKAHPKTNYQRSLTSDILLGLRPRVKEMVKNVDQIAESIASTQVSSVFEKKLLSLRKQALLIPFSEVRLLQKLEKDDNTEDPLPKNEDSESAIGKRFVASVLEFLLQHLVEEDCENSQNAEKKQEGRVTTEINNRFSKKDSVIGKKEQPMGKHRLGLKEKIEVIRNHIADLKCTVKAEFSDPFRVVRALESKGLYSNKSLDIIYHKIWEEKVANYLAALLDCMCKSTEEHFIPLIGEVTTKYLNRYKRHHGLAILNFLLHLYQRGSFYDEDTRMEDELQIMARNARTSVFNPYVFSQMMIGGQIVFLCNTVNHTLFPKLIGRFLEETNNMIVLESSFTYLIKAPIDKIIVSCPPSQVEVVTDAYMSLLDPCIALMHNACSDLVVSATKVVIKLLHVKIAQDIVWKFEFQSIVLRNLYRTGRPQVIKVTLVLFMLLLDIEMMPIMFCDPDLDLMSAILNLCNTIKYNSESFSGEDIHRLMGIVLIIGTKGAISGYEILKSVSAKYSKIFTGYNKEPFENEIKCDEKILNGVVMKVKNEDAKKQETSEVQLWKKLWSNFTPPKEKKQEVKKLEESKSGK